MQELLRNMQEKRDSAYRVYREAELTENEAGLAHSEGVLDGMDIMINLVKERMEE
jgi:hypothetical protein